MNYKISEEDVMERPQTFLMVYSVFSVAREIRDHLYPKPDLSSRTITRQDLGSWGQALDAIVTPDTVDAIGNDPKLRRTLISMVDFSVDLSDALAARYETLQLGETRKALQTYKEKLRRSLEGLDDNEARGFQDDEDDEPSTVEKRQLPGIGGFFGAGSGAPNPSGAPPGGGAGNPLTGLLPGGGAPGAGAGGETMSPGVLSGLIAPLTDGLKNIGNQLVANLDGPAMFLGIGVGAGAAQGLNLSTQEKVMQVASKVAADNNMQATGLNPAIQNVGIGLTSTLLSSVNFSDVGGNSISGQLQPIAMSLATGLGNGTVSGLKLKTTANLEPVNDSSIPNVVGTFGFGLTKTIVSNVDFNALLKDQNSNGNTNFSQMIMKILPAAASGFGKGLGQGATVGLGLQPDSDVPMQQMPDGQIDFGGISQTFAKGLTSSFLQNGTANELINKVGGSMKTQSDGGVIPSTIKFNGQSIEVARVAQGFARGLLQGAGDAIQGMGGVESLFNGNATMPGGALPDSRVQFDDSLGGAASGFGSGIGGQGVLVIYGLAKNPRGNPEAAGAAAPAAVAGAPKTSRRELGLVPRQDPPPIVSVNTTDGFNLSVVINAQTVSMAAQAGLNALTCQGVGGLGLIGLGLIRSKTIALDFNSKNDNVTRIIKQVIPTGEIKLANEGNTYALDGQVIRDSLSGSILGATNGIEVNGMKLPAFIAFLVIHILFGIVAFINVLPFAIGLEHLRNIMIRINAPQVLPNAHKWNNIMWLFVVAPSVVVVFVFGVAAVGKSSHFRTAHGIVSLFTTLVGLAAVLMHLAIKARAPPQLPNSRSSPAPPAPLLGLSNIRVLLNQLFLILAFVSVVTGFADLSAVALCFTQIIPFDIALVIGFGLSTVFVLGSSISGLDISLTIRDFLRHRKASKGGSSAGSSGLRGKVSPPPKLPPVKMREKDDFA
ncbi:hypothetical protein CCHL11_06045 [Colletotrichum chlorophyti]|uniref:Uncharacterized protein n=1 Tax=Colletotrichum chlorophyti TaxID=708187 RepID=A0A1Q8RWZ2_9PEZI|nr:hypothetical protein CCHL11_06045 [Colletotrichum chlorophyti]